MRIVDRLGLTAILAAATACALALPAAAQDHVWRHGLLKAKADAGILLMVGAKDFAKKQGLDLKISQFHNDSIEFKALIAGEIDSFEGGPQGVFSADAKGADIRILGCHWVVVPHVIFAKDSIKKIADLKGKTVAVSAPNSMPDMLAHFAMEKYGVNTKDVKFAAVGGDRDRYQALVGGVVDAAVVSNEYQPIAPKSIHVLLAGRDAMPKFIRICLMTSETVLKKKGDDAVKFLAAEMNALHYAMSHRAETIALTKKLIHAKADDPRPAFVFDEAVRLHMVDPTLPLPMDKLQWAEEQMLKIGKLKKPMDAKTVVAPEYREKALKLAGS